MAPKAKVTAVSSKTTSTAASGLQLSAAQWKVYSSVYTATQRRLAIAAAAKSLRKSRLSAAYATQKKAAVARSVASAAAIAANATRVSYRNSVLAHQNTALKNRVYADMAQHMTIAGRAQYIAGGEKSYAQAAVLRTLTTAQATTIEAATFAKAVKTAKVAASGAKVTVAGAAIAKAAKAAATAAAKASPAGRTAPRPAHLMLPLFREPFGDPEGYDCVAAAIATHLDFRTAYRMTPQEYGTLTARLGDGPALEDALNVVAGDGLSGSYRLSSFGLTEPRAGTRLVAGFATANGPHAALLLSDLLVFSWGEVLRLQDVMLPGTAIEEAWDLTWEPLG